MKQNKNKNLWWSILPIFGVLLALSFFFPTNAPKQEEAKPEFVALTKSTPAPTPPFSQTNTPSPSISPTQTPVPTNSPESQPQTTPLPEATATPLPSTQPSETPTHTTKQTPVPKPTPITSIKITSSPAEETMPPQETAVPNPSVTETPMPTKEPVSQCSLSIQCQNALKPDSGLDQSIRDILPADGVIFQAKNIGFTKEESAFDLLSRELLNRNIHFEYNYNPMFHSAYIEGIHNLYEFDCGSQSGWLYFVNGKSPDCGCSQYIIQPGDHIEFIYSCSFGSDIF